MTLPSAVPVAIARSLVLGFTLIVGLAAALLLHADGRDGLTPLDGLRVALIAIATSWLGWGAAQSLLGLPPPRRRRSAPDVASGVASGTEPPPATPPSSGERVAVLVPVCNEDPVAVFARIAAMDESFAAEGLGDVIDVVVLSDTSDEGKLAAERRWFARLVRERDGEGRLFYRRRRKRQGRKAGNVGDFIARSGAAYVYALILDADSLMEGATVAEMRRRMAADPSLGLLQSLPCVIGARSVFGRALQFAGSFYSPVFARGVARLQGRTGPFWGHNAMIRVRAFAASCALPELSGRPPFGGHVLSHDYVEAALLARAGWTVRLDDDLDGSFEEGPDNLVAFARRDRRWCQGNLQHARLLFVPGLRGWSRFVFLQGILVYLAPLFWAGFLLSSVVAAATLPPPDYFPEPHQLFPVFPDDRTAEVLGLAVGIVGLLVLPKLSIALRVAASGRSDGFGGPSRAFLSVAAELVLSSIVAPVLLLYQSRSVLQVLRGGDGGWPASQRGEGRLGLAEAWAASGWIAVAGIAALAALWLHVPALLPWMLPVCLPMALAPSIVRVSSLPLPGPLFLTPLEHAPAPVVLAFRRRLRAWEGGADAGTEPSGEAGEPRALA